MKNTSFIFSLIVFSFCASFSFAQTSKTFTLKDGATFQGHLSTVENGIYTVESPTLGSIKLHEADIVTITSADRPTTTPTALPLQPTTATSSAEQVKTMQTKIISDPAIMADIQALTANPRLVQILTDPSLLTAAAQGPEALQGNPQAAELFKDPEIQALIKKIQASQPQP